MKIYDCIYGEFNIEPIFEKLIDTTEFQRLKNIHQGGATYLVNPKWNVTRYEHSVGTMLLIRLLGGSIEEQIMGLLHDISHTAFSHVVDYVLDKSNEDYHEEIYNSIIENSSIPAILKKEGFDYKDILFNEEKWTILEQPLPNLCADRIDYTLRDMYHYNNTPLSEITNFLNSLTLIDRKIVTTTLDAAKWFTKLYYSTVIDFFMHPLNIYSYEILAKALKQALDFKIINLKDFSSDDNTLYSKLLACNNTEVLDTLSLLSKKVSFKEDTDDYDIFQKKKLRLIDPPLLYNRSVVPASTTSNTIKTLSSKALEKSNKGVYLKVFYN